MVLCNGIACFFFFASLRHNDNHLVSLSQLEAKWAAAVRAYYPTDEYSMYGDSIFRQTYWVNRPYRGAARGSPHRQRNANMSPIRIPNEWHFGNQGAKINFVGKLGRNQMLAQPVETFLEVANFVHNCLVCLHGSQTESYFDVPAPSLEQYCGKASRHDAPAAPFQEEGDADDDSSDDGDDWEI